MSPMEPLSANPKNQDLACRPLSCTSRPTAPGVRRSGRRSSWPCSRLGSPSRGGGGLSLEAPRLRRLWRAGLCLLTTPPLSSVDSGLDPASSPYGGCCSCGGVLGGSGLLRRPLPWPGLRGACPESSASNTTRSSPVSPKPLAHVRADSRAGGCWGLACGWSQGSAEARFGASFGPDWQVGWAREPRGPPPVGMRVLVSGKGEEAGSLLAARQPKQRGQRKGPAWWGEGLGLLTACTPPKAPPQWPAWML